MLLQLGRISMFSLVMTVDSHAAGTVVDSKHDSTIGSISVSHIGIAICFGSSVIPRGGSGVVPVMPSTVGCSIVFPAAAYRTTSVDAEVA